MPIQEQYLERVDMREFSPSEMPLFISPIEIQKILQTLNKREAFLKFLKPGRDAYLFFDCSQNSGNQYTFEKVRALLLDIDGVNTIVITKPGNTWELSKLAKEGVGIFFPDQINKCFDTVITSRNDILALFTTRLVQSRLEGLSILRDPVVYEEQRGRRERKVMFQTLFTVLEKSYKIKRESIKGIRKEVLANIFFTALDSTGYRSHLSFIRTPDSFFSYCKKRLLDFEEILNYKRDLHKYLNSKFLGIATRKHALLIRGWAEKGLVFHSYGKWSQIVVMAQLETLLTRKREEYKEAFPLFNVNLQVSPIEQISFFISHLFEDTFLNILNFHNLHGFYVKSPRRIMSEHPFINQSKKDLYIDVMKTVLYVTRFIRAKLPRGQPLKPILTVNNTYSYLSPGYNLAQQRVREYLELLGKEYTLVDPEKYSKAELKKHIRNCLYRCNVKQWTIQKTEDLAFERITGLPMNFVYKRLKTTTIVASKK